MAEQTQKKEKDPLNTQEVAIDAFNKKIKEHVSGVVEQAINAPEPTDFNKLLGNLLEAYPSSPTAVQTPEEILKEVAELANKPVGTGEKEGPGTSLIHGLMGKGFQRDEITEPLGQVGAFKALEVIAKQKEDARKEAKDVRGIPKERVDLIQAVINLVPDLQKLLTPQEGTTLERDPQGNLTTKGIEQEIRAKKLAEASVERQAKFRASESEMTAFIHDFERSEQEIIDKVGPGALESGIIGASMRIKGKGQELLNQLPISTAFKRKKRARANQMARNVEGGRVTDQDRQVYADILSAALDGSSITNVELLSGQLIDMALKLDPDERVLSITPQIEGFLNSKSPTLRRAGELAQKTLFNNGDRGVLKYDTINKAWGRVYPDGSSIDLGPEKNGQPGFDMFRDPSAAFPQNTNPNEAVQFPVQQGGN